MHRRKSFSRFSFYRLLPLQVEEEEGRQDDECLVESRVVLNREEGKGDSKGNDTKINKIHVFA